MLTYIVRVDAEGSQTKPRAEKNTPGQHRFPDPNLIVMEHFNNFNICILHERCCLFAGKG